MSDRFGLKVKENAGKTKYSSLNLNQTYKGTKVETKTSSGTARHGLQSLGKVGASRRIPPPANLPSLKSENSGNDPTVSLVPSGGGGWGSTKEKASENPPATSQPALPSSTPSQANVPTSQPPLLQPQRPIPPPSHPQQPQPQSQNSGQTQTQPVKQPESQAKTWGTVSSNGAGGPGKTSSHQEMPYFNREFPVLGGGGSGERMPPHMEEKDHHQYGPRPMMRNTHEPAWMERSGPGPPPPDYGPSRERPEVYNGGPGPGYTGGPQYRRPPDYQHAPHGKNYPHGYPPHHHGSGPHGYGPGPGRHAHGYPPDYFSRGPVHKPGGAPGTVYPSKLYEGQGEGYGRPAILKPEDIQAMADNDEEEEGGWAGAQDEVDYAAKLDFEDFEDDDKPPATPAREKNNRDVPSNEPDTRWQSSEGRSGKEMGPPPTRPTWSETQGAPHPYPDSRQVPPGPGMRPFDSRGSPPAPGWPMPYPQHMAAQQRGGGMPAHPPPGQGKPAPKEGEPVVNEWQKRRVKQQEEMRAAVERARRRREDEELKRQAEQKAAATAKLKELEMKRIRRESGKEGDDAWAEELDSIEKDVHSKEPIGDHKMSESPYREHEPPHTTVTQHDGAPVRNEVPEHITRQRNDSESSDASRSSVSRGTSRAHHHPPRDIPPRFQQQQLRQQQQQHFQPHYQQQQPHPQQYQYHHQQLPRSPQHREFQEGPLTISSHYPVVDTGPVSPSQPVRRIMKRSDSSSTAGDDTASVKSLESGSWEATRESEKRPSGSSSSKTDKANVNSEQTKEGSFEAQKSDSRTEKKAVDDQDIPVFDEADSVEAGDLRQRKQLESEKPELSESGKEKVVVKEGVPDKTERKDSRDGTAKPVPEKTPQNRDRREERRVPKRDARQDERRTEDPKDLGKRKRDDNDEGARFPERRGRFAGRGDSKRERFSESHGHGRVSFPVRGHGRGMGSGTASYRGRGRGERGFRDGRDGRDSRDYREHKPSRSREPRAPAPTKSIDSEQKPKEEDKENAPVKENSFKSINDTTETVEEHAVVVKQEKEVESSPSLPEKVEVTQRKDEEMASKEKKDTPLQQENKVGESEDSSAKLPDRDTEKPRREDDSRKKSDSNREAANFKPKGRGGFGKPPQYCDDSRRPAADDKRPGSKKFTDRRRATQDSGRDRRDYYEDRRSSRNYSRDQTGQRPSVRDNRNWERGREKEQKSQSRHDDRDTGNRRYSQDDRKKRISEKVDDQQYSRQRPDDRNQRGGYRSSSSTRGHFGKPPQRGNMRGGRPSQQVGSGRLGNYRRSKSTDEELSDDDYDSDSSSYTTATSASEERRDEITSDKDTDVKKGKESSTSFDKPRNSLQSTRSPVRGKMSSRAGGRGTGGFGRSRREVERPPRFQKQQERERAGLGRGVSRGDRYNEGRESGPGRGRGRGRGRREQFPKDSSEGPGIPVTEDWDEELGDSIKEGESSRGDKTGTRKESQPRRGFPVSRTTSDRTRKDKSRESGGTRNISFRREPFLAERQQAKVEGSKSAGGEPRVPLPAARNGFSKDGNRRPDMQNSSHGTGLDSINTGVVETKVSRKQEAPVRKTDIQQFDLHNIAGVICIDDMTDDDSDISSTLSGFVEVTSRRTQKENKDRQREEEERKKKADEQNRQRSNQASGKKNQSSKPPRFSKQHLPQANTQSKAPGVIGKSVSTAVSEAVAGLTNIVSNSNPSSASSTKRNSPVTVERPISPPPPPVFNAWDKPLIVTPAKPPNAAPLITTSVPDPLAVGSGKPSSTRPAQSGTVMPSPPSLIEDASVDEDYIAMTKEIALLAPPEEPEESEEPSQPVTTTKPKVQTTEQSSEKGAKHTDTLEKRSQPKPQRERPPRFDRTGKRRVGASGDETKKDQSGSSKGRKGSRENLGSQKLQAKASRDKNLKGKTATNTQQQSLSAEEQTGNGLDTPKEVQEAEEYDVTAVTTVSDEGSEEKDDLKESEEREAKDDSESESSRKDSEPDLNVDSNERNSDADNLFSTGSLTVDIHERSTTDRPAREPSPVSPAIFEMTKKMEASRKLWEGGLDIRRTGNPVAAWEETLRTPASVSSSIVGMPVVESTELRLNDDQVTVSKSQGELEVNTSKADSKPSDGINFSKKTGSGEQQNVCKVKPQQQQQPSVKPQQSSSVVPQTTEESHPNELNTVPLSQPLLTQDHLLAQQAIPQRFPYPLINQYMNLQQRQPFLRQEQLQQLQETNQQVNPTFPLTHVQQVNQARSSSSPLSQAAQDIYQSSFLASGVYSAGNFQGTQPYVSLALLPSTTTQSYATSTSRTQTTSLMGIQPQQPKTANTSVFPQNVNPQAGQTMYMSFDPKSFSSGAPLFNLTQHPQPAQRHLLRAQSGIVGDSVPRQGSYPTAQPTHQAFQATYPFQQKQGPYDVSQDVQLKQKGPEQTDYSRQSELVKHVNAKPFEPPKRSIPGSVSPAGTGNAVIGPLVSSTFARNPNMMTIHTSPTDLGGTSQSPPVSTSIISGRAVSMSPVDPSIPFPGAVGTFPKHTAISQFQVQQQPQGVQPQQFTPFQQQPVGIQHTLQIRPQAQQQQQAVNPLSGATATIVPNPAVMAATMPRQLIRAPGLGALGVGGAQPSAPNAQRFPSPIQRPMTTSLMHGVPHMQAPRGPRPQTAPPQLVPTKQVVSNRPQMPQPSVPHQDPVAAAFKLEQHHKMMEQTRMFFAQQGQQQQQQRVPQNIPADQPKAMSSSLGDKPTIKSQPPRETHKLQEKKEEVNPRNRKTNSEQPNKTSKTTKLDSKPEESSKDKNTKQDGKIAANKSTGSSSSIVRIQPLHMPARNKPNRPRGPPRMPGMPPNKAKLSGRPEKEAKDTSASDQPKESSSPKNSNQGKASEAQSVPPLGVNKG